MYMGYSSATCIYACCTIGRARICGKIMFLALGFSKRDFKFAKGNGKRPFVQVFIG
jgi:hypothetical protein